MFRLSRVIIRPYKEQVQGYLSILCTLGSQALTKGVVIITAPCNYYNTTFCKRLGSQSARYIYIIFDLFFVEPDYDSRESKHVAQR